MCIRDSQCAAQRSGSEHVTLGSKERVERNDRGSELALGPLALEWIHIGHGQLRTCLLYTSDAADARSSVDIGGRRIFTKKKKKQHTTLR